MNDAHATALPWHVSRWFNTPAPIALEQLRGKVVAIHAFQMLCPGCVSDGLPQATRMHESLAGDQFAVIGLHTVFEHHAVMDADALAAFIHEYRLAFPIGIDEASAGNPIPRTMAAWGLRGTPSLVLLDRNGQVQLSHFGRIDDLALGTIIGQLLERPLQPRHGAAPESGATGCDDAACPAPPR